MAVPRITLERLSLVEAGRPVLQDVDLEVAEGEWLVVTGARDAGAEALARVVAGVPSGVSGRVLFDGQDVTHSSAAERQVVVARRAVGPFESPLPGPTGGLAGLRRVFGAGGTRSATPAPLPTLRSVLADAGGGSTRVVVSLDALSHLDRQARRSEWAELLTMHRRRPVTVVHSTSDREESMALAQRLAVLDDGRILQVGPPDWLYDRPVTTRVALALGDPPINLIHGHVVLDEGRPMFEAAGQWLAALPAGTAALAGRPMTLGIRPEDLRVSGSAAGALVDIRAVEPTGPAQTVFAMCASGFDLVAVLPPRPLAVPGAARFVVPPERLHLFSASGDRFFAADDPMPR
jgi:multiple sugar transport system ATP-binding protein